MTSPNPGEIEREDSAKVDRALAALAAGNTAEAETLLLSVIANCPAGYTNSSEAPDGAAIIKFWTQHDFIHYVMWQKQQGIERGVQWIGNAYPRAYYYLGFICVKNRQYKQALQYLTRGHELEPTNPNFNFEKAQALVHSGDKAGALALYQAVTEIGPSVSARDLAVAQRGRGFVLIELGRLDEAEAAFRSSLEIEPGSPVALNELEYIENLRRGGRASPAESVQTSGPGMSQCAMCGNSFTQGVVVDVRGVPHIVCEKCNRKTTKKWWQFWK